MHDILTLCCIGSFTFLIKYSALQKPRIASCVSDCCSLPLRSQMKAGGDALLMTTKALWCNNTHNDFFSDSLFFSPIQHLHWLKWKVFVASTNWVSVKGHGSVWTMNETCTHPYTDKLQTHEELKKVYLSLWVFWPRNTKYSWFISRWGPGWSKSTLNLFVQRH